MLSNQAIILKSSHRAKADFLRDLRSLTNDLYALGDASSENPARAHFRAKLDGFVEAGLLIEVATRDEVQRVIDDCHQHVFSETRSERRDRLRGSEAPSIKQDVISRACEPDWDSYDTPAYDRINR